MADVVGRTAEIVRVRLRGDGARRLLGSPVRRRAGIGGTLLYRVDLEVVTATIVRRPQADTIELRLASPVESTKHVITLQREQA